MSWLGIDIGGANLKAADGAGWARSVPFALWREPQNLAAELKALIESAPPGDRLAVTMTGELCDCFRSKPEGVRHILKAVDQAAGGREIRVYHVDGRFASTAEATIYPHLAAASNWHALAAFAGRYAPEGVALLIDIGSTTTDVIPLVDGKVVAAGSNDMERLLLGELIYRGVRRTPICALCKTLPWNGSSCSVAAEFFATTADAYLLLGMLPEEPSAEWTADGRPLSKEHARQRLARQLCADARELGTDAIDQIARAVHEAQLAELRQSISTVVGRLLEPPSTFILSGSGEFLGRAAAEQSSGARCVSLGKLLGEQASECGPALAVAVLAKEREV
jgi:(4-(4-[2-(gamma-L-glutamylamino)ethyl]phenoxymethyl)furan-2-yl)methanamine synthase